MEEKVTNPVAELLETAATSDQVLAQKLQGAMHFLTEEGPHLIGDALRTLAQSYNDLANKRFENVVNDQPLDVQQGLEPVTPGFDTFFSQDVSPIMTTAQAAQTIRLTRDALRASSGRSKYAGGNGRNERRSMQAFSQKKARYNVKATYRPGYKHTERTPNKHQTERTPTKTYKPRGNPKEHRPFKGANRGRK
jgi:hypothetical protein